jgi:hypothetical protein
MLHSALAQVQADEPAWPVLLLSAYGHLADKQDRRVPPDAPVMDAGLFIAVVTNRLPGWAHSSD